MCDDACRMEACLWDQGDCELGCRNDICSQIFTVWNFLGGGEEYNYQHDTVCSQWAPVAVAFFEATDEFNGEYNQCIELIINTDHNNDGYMNFREFVQVVYELFDNSIGDRKPKQVNCSSCVGMKYIL